VDFGKSAGKTSRGEDHEDILKQLEKAAVVLGFTITGDYCSGSRHFNGSSCFICPVLAKAAVKVMYFSFLSIGADAYIMVYSYNPLHVWLAETFGDWIMFEQHDRNNAIDNAGNHADRGTHLRER
jgi:hypothetical protein